MFDELLNSLVALLPTRVFLGLLAIVGVGIALLVLWAAKG